MYLRVKIVLLQFNQIMMIWHTDNEIKRLIAYYNPKNINEFLEDIELTKELIQRYDIT